MESAIGVTILMTFLILLVLAWGVAEYVLHSLGLFKIASKKQIENPWLSWIPIGADWIVGKIAEEYDERNGIKRKWSVLLLVSEIISMVSIGIFFVSYFVFLFFIIEQFQHSEPPVGLIIVFVLFIIIFAFFMTAVSMMYSGCQLICMYKIFESCVPEKTFKYWLFYLLVPIVGNMSLVKCGKIDESTDQETEWDEDLSE